MVHSKEHKWPCNTNQINQKQTKIGVFDKHGVITSLKYELTKTGRNCPTHVFTRETLLGERFSPNLTLIF